MKDLTVNQKAQALRRLLEDYPAIRFMYIEKDHIRFYGDITDLQLEKAIRIISTQTTEEFFRFIKYVQKGLKYDGIKSGEYPLHDFFFNYDF